MGQLIIEPNVNVQGEQDGILITCPRCGFKQVEHHGTPFDKWAFECNGCHVVMEVYGTKWDTHIFESIPSDRGARVEFGHGGRRGPI